MSSSAPSRARVTTDVRASSTAKRAAARARMLVLDVARHHFGEPARRVVECGGGLTNAVYQLKVTQGDFVVRTHENATKIQDYLKEQWAMEAARAADVPAPKVLEVGNLDDGRAYMILERVAGREGNEATNRLEVIEQMGRLAARLHTIRTRGFGGVFDWSSNSLSKHTRWPDYLEDGLGVDRRIDTLARNGMIGRGQVRWLRRTVAAIADARQRPVLHHGDLRLKNLIVEPRTGRIAALIDWESCTSMPGPAWDLSIALHDLGIDGKEAFLTGYGMSAERFVKTLDVVRCFNVLNYAPPVQSAATRKDHRRLAWFRVRLAGQLDLFQP